MPYLFFDAKKGSSGPMGLCGEIYQFVKAYDVGVMLGKIHGKFYVSHKFIFYRLPRTAGFNSLLIIYRIKKL